MQTHSILKAIKKAGLKVETENHVYYWCKTDKKILSWYDENNGKATCIRVRRLCDYLPGFSVNTIKFAIKYLTE